MIGDIFMIETNYTLTKGLYQEKQQAPLNNENYERFSLDDVLAENKKEKNTSSTAVSAQLRVSEDTNRSLIHEQETEYSASDEIEDEKSSAVKEFMAYMEKTPEERIRHQILAQMGLTEEELEAMPPEERAKVEEEIVEKIKDMIKEGGEKAENNNTAPLSTEGMKLSDVKQLDQLPIFNIAEAPNEAYETFIEGQTRFLESKYSSFPSTQNHPAYKDYAEIRVNGKIVAKLNNNGSLETSNALGPKLQGKIPNGENGLKGPMLAQARAEKIAELLGGEVVKSPTALTQSSFKDLPEIHSKINYGALKEDSLYIALQKTLEARIKFLEQQS